jgi:hypothetical protein
MYCKDEGLGGTPALVTPVGIPVKFSKLNVYIDRF